MKLEQFMDELLAASLAAGMEAAEAYGVETGSFVARATDGTLSEYKVSSTAGVGLRGVVNGRMGYAGTQAFDQEAVSQLVSGVLESAELNEAEEQDEIFAGDESYPDCPPADTDLDGVTA